MFLIFSFQFIYHIVLTIVLFLPEQKKAVDFYPPTYGKAK